ncbi:MAG: hypothetical protein ACEY3K_09310, partial [Wolbachia sp.]
CLKIHPSIYRNYQSLQIFCPILTSLSLNLMAVVKIPPVTKQEAIAGTVPTAIPVAINDNPAKNVTAEMQNAI